MKGICFGWGGGYQLWKSWNTFDLRSGEHEIFFGFNVLVVARSTRCAFFQSWYLGVYERHLFWLRRGYQFWKSCCPRVVFQCPGTWVVAQCPGSRCHSILWRTKPMYSHPGAVPGKANGVWESVLNGPTRPLRDEPWDSTGIAKMSEKRSEVLSPRGGAGKGKWCLGVCTVHWLPLEVSARARYATRANLPKCHGEAIGYSHPRGGAGKGKWCLGVCTVHWLPLEVSARARYATRSKMSRNVFFCKNVVSAFWKGRMASSEKKCTFRSQKNVVFEKNFFRYLFSPGRNCIFFKGSHSAFSRSIMAQIQNF